MSAGSYQAIIEATLEVARERRQQLDRIREALVRGDEASALHLMRIHVGIDDGEEESDCADPGLH